MAHHPLGHQFDPGLRIDHHQRGIDPGQRRHRLTGKIRVARRIEQLNPRPFVRQTGQRREQAVPGLLFLRIVVAYGITTVDAAPRRNCTAGVEQRFGQRGLTRSAVTNQRHGTELRNLQTIRHLFLPEW